MFLFTFGSNNNLKKPTYSTVARSCRKSFYEIVLYWVGLFEKGKILFCNLYGFHLLLCYFKFIP